MIAAVLGRLHSVGAGVYMYMHVGWRDLYMSIRWG